jgi:hypothetical protein
VQGGHDDFQRGFLRELGVRVDRDAASVVGDGQKAAFLELDLDEGGVAGHRLVHGVVDHLSKEVVQRLLVSAADIHTRPPPDGLEAFQNLDGGGVVAGLGGRPLRSRNGRSSPGERRLGACRLAVRLRIGPTCGRTAKEIAPVRHRAPDPDRFVMSRAYTLFGAACENER